MSRIALALLVLCACGRTSVLDEADAGVDAGVVPSREDAIFVAAEGTSLQCAVTASEGALRVRDPGDRLVLLKTKAQDECSGAGGEYLLGSELDGARDYFLGEHACYFLSTLMREARETVFFGVARVTPQPAATSTPTGWCITGIGGQEPVTTDARVRVWAVYRTEAAARAALQEFAP